MWAGRECLSRAATFFQVLGHQAEAQGPCMQMPRPTGLLARTLAPTTNCRPHQNCYPPPTTSLPQETEVRGETWSGGQVRLLPPAHHLPQMCPLSPLLNPNSDKKPELPMRLSLTAPRCVRRMCLKMTSEKPSST